MNVLATFSIILVFFSLKQSSNGGIDNKGLDTKNNLDLTSVLGGSITSPS